MWRNNSLFSKQSWNKRTYTVQKTPKPCPKPYLYTEINSKWITDVDVKSEFGDIRSKHMIYKRKK